MIKSFIKRMVRVIKGKSNKNIKEHSYSSNKEKRIEEDPFIKYCDELLILFDSNDEDFETYDMIYFDED